jgi:hypothetical protein
LTLTVTDDTVQVRITRDSTCFIDDEFFAPPPGASLNQAVLAHLRLEAAALGSPVRAVIRDEQADYTMTIQVNSDGTSQPLNQRPPAPTPAPAPGPPPSAAPFTPQGSTPSATLPWADPVPPDRPYEPLPEPYGGRLEAICTTARQNRLREAAAAADQLISELTAQFGPTHLYTLAAGSVRGDIAWLMRDNRYALQIWTFVAKAWHKLLGPTHKTTIWAVGNAVGCWRQLPHPDALAEGGTITTLLQEVPIPEAESTLRTIDQHLQRYAAAVLKQ